MFTMITLILTAAAATTGMKEANTASAFEVRIVRVANQNDAIGTRDYSIDCVAMCATRRKATGVGKYKARGKARKSRATGRRVWRPLKIQKRVK